MLLLSPLYDLKLTMTSVVRCYCCFLRARMGALLANDYVRVLNSEHESSLKGSAIAVRVECESKPRTEKSKSQQNQHYSIKNKHTNEFMVHFPQKKKNTIQYRVTGLGGWPTCIFFQ